ncbi:hypothetical protein A3Q56_08154 [Intoshia linei]|uniref:Growth factor receptor domain-containing protein n=1 Tax=Intoshia linei TaxID=1819745 RepID=A0A177ARZ0_9BILA|nr:hypothetical protein A3Q56_08154 [Intoshia linei]
MSYQCKSDRCKYCHLKQNINVCVNNCPKNTYSTSRGVCHHECGSEPCQVCMNSQYNLSCAYFCSDKLPALDKRHICRTCGESNCSVCHVSTNKLSKYICKMECNTNFVAGRDNICKYCLIDIFIDPYICQSCTQINEKYCLVGIFNYKLIKV